MKFSKLADAYVKALRFQKNYSENTAKAYDTAYQQFVTSFSTAGKIDDIKSFTVESVMRFVQDLNARGANPNTVNTKLTALGSLARWAMRQELDGKPVMTRNPVDNVDRPQFEEPEEKYLLPAEYEAFLAAVGACPLRERVAMVLLLDTALRSSELANATWGDLEEMAGGAFLKGAVKGRGTRRRKKLFPLDPETAALLKDWHLERNLPDPGERILLNAEGKPMNRSSMHYLTCRVAEDGFAAAGLPTRFDVTPHVIRHTVNMMRDIGGVSGDTQSQLLGHRNNRSRETYQHVQAHQLLAAKAAQRAGRDRYLGKA